MDRSSAAYDEDFYAWTQAQAQELRRAGAERNNAPVDWENVAEEIESLGRSEEHQIDSRLEVLLQHLLKWHFQPEKRTNSWKASILEQRIRIGRIIKDSPSLKRYPSESLRGSFIIGRGGAITETGLPESVFPEACPYTIEQILDPDFLPG